MSDRKLRRKKQLAERKAAMKAARQAGNEVANAISSMPTKCDECSAPFDKKDKQMINHWRIAVYDDGRVNLVCPDCVPDDVKNVS